MRQGAFWLLDGVAAVRISDVSATSRVLISGHWYVVYHMRSRRDFEERFETREEATARVEAFLGEVI